MKNKQFSDCRLRICLSTEILRERKPLCIAFISLQYLTRKKNPQLTCFTVGKNNYKLNPGKLFTTVPFLSKAGVVCCLMGCKGGASAPWCIVGTWEQKEIPLYCLVRGGEWGGVGGAPLCCVSVFHCWESWKLGCLLFVIVIFFPLCLLKM